MITIEELIRKEGREPGGLRRTKGAKKAKRPFPRIDFQDIFKSMEKYEARWLKTMNREMRKTSPVFKGIQWRYR